MYVTSGEVDLGVEEKTYRSLSQALEEAWFAFTSVWMLEGVHQWVTAGPRNSSTPREFPHRTITVKTLLAVNPALCFAAMDELLFNYERIVLHF